MGVLAIIPARGGSKRIPGKNTKLFLGEPIISYSIKLALASDLFEEVMVSTDNDEVAAVASNTGASVPFKRSKINSNDHATLADVIVEVLLQYKKQDKEFDTVCCILPTAALLTQKRLIEAFHKFKEEDYTSLVPVMRFAYPIQRALKDHNGLLEMREEKYLRSRSQDMEIFYHDAGQFYWINTKKFLQEKTIFTSKTGYLELKETEVQDVDTLIDWEMLLVKYNFLHTIK